MSSTRLKKLCRILLAGSALAAVVLIAGWLLTPAPRVDDFAVSPTLLDRRGQLFHARLSADEEWLLPLPLSEMSPWLPKVAVAIEDKRFERHPGVDFLALGRAVWQNVRHGRIISGASTITSQVVRISTDRDRTLFNKYVEFIQALKLERNMGKKQLLEIYLNRAPFGGNLRGVEAASRAYFNKTARDLSLGESALLVALLRGPTIYRPDRNPVLARQRRDLILDRLEGKGFITAAESASAKAEPVSGRQGPGLGMPRRAWHLAELILSESGGPKSWRWGDKGRQYGLKTSLDLKYQDQLEMRFNLGLAQFPERVTGAGAIMDNNSGELLAYVGNARWRPGLSRHWVDCARAFRSPGSTLKPFIYLAAFSERGLTPASMLADSPLKLSGQAPRNFDEFYRGPVSAQTALADSLNAPAVRVLRMVGQTRVQATLRRAGFSHLGRESRYYGDALVLGGCEVTLWQMLKGYGALASLGAEVRPGWRLAASGDGGRSGGREAGRRQLFSAGAVWLVNECLKDDSRLPINLRLSRENSFTGELAFKTGTSHGLRDAWLAAYTPDRTIVLWAGDPAGQAHPDLVGLKALGPVLVPLVNDLKLPANWPPRPDSLESYSACSISGQPAGAHCPARYPAYRLAAGAKSHPCRIHVLQGGQVRAQWPPELSGFMAALDGEAGTRLNPDFASAPVISSPPKNGTIILDEAGGRIPLRSEGTRGLVHWFVNDEFYRSAPPGFTPVLNLKPGRHRVTLVDADGRSTATEFTVMYSQEQDRDRDLPLLEF